MSCTKRFKLCFQISDIEELAGKGIFNKEGMKKGTSYKLGIGVLMADKNVIWRINGGKELKRKTNAQTKHNPPPHSEAV